MTDDIPLERSAAKLRPLLDKPYPVSASGLQILAPAENSENDAVLAETTTTTTATTTTTRSSPTKKTPGRKRRAPRMRMCHLCGTPQLLRSYKMHYSKCAEAWERDEEANKPEQNRRPLPDCPQLNDGSQPNETTKLEDLEEFNRLALKIWKSQALETCPNCQRSFHAKALKAHMKGCHAESFLGPSFISASKRSEASRTRRYPTVRQSIERHARTPEVSKPGPIKLVQERVDAFRGVPPRRHSTDTSSPANSFTTPPRPTSCSTLKSSPSPTKTPRKWLVHRSSSYAYTPKTLTTPSSSSLSSSPEKKLHSYRPSSAAASCVTPRRRPSSRRRQSAPSRDLQQQQREHYERRFEHLLESDNRNNNDESPRSRRRRPRPGFEARLDALEAEQLTMSDTLHRIEALLLSSAWLASS